MSKNISIQEGGVSKQMTVDKLKTNLVGGGSCLWVPEDGTQLTTKYISENGTYKASDDGYYGYSEVTVSGVGSVVGRDSNGNEAIVTADPVTGDLVTTEIPSSILVVMPPTTTTYTDGATIDFTGLVVKAYTQDGEVWTDSLHPNGEIPISELTLPVTKADAQGAHAEESATSDLIQGSVPCTNFMTLVQHNSNDDVIYTYTEATFAVIAGSQTDMLGASNAPGDCLERFRRVPTAEGGIPAESNKRISLHRQFTHNGKTVYWAEWGQLWRYDEVSIGNAPALTQEVAWTIVYGDITRTDVTQTIPVQWTRSDGKTLESSFDITVT